MLGFNLIKPKRIQNKIIIMGGSLDKSLVLKDLKKTAEIYNTEPIVFEGVSHDVMLDKQWKSVIEKIIEVS